MESARWRYLLDELAAEARGLPWEKGQAVLTAVVADAYWDLDRNESSRLFTQSFDDALSHEPHGDANRRAALRHVISLAARRDITLAKNFIARLLKSPSKDDRGAGETIAVASDLIESEPGKAAKLAEAAAPAGPSLDAAWFIMQLAKKDPAAAERVYSSYLEGFTSGRSAGLNRLMWLAGYPFGYVEAFGFSLNSAEVEGFNGLRSPRLDAQPALAATFIQIAHREAQNALKEAAVAPAPRRDILYGLVLFTATYLLPEVMRYRPQATQAWQSISYQASAGASAAWKEAVAKRAQDVFRGRLSADGSGPEAHTAEGDPQSALDRAEKLTNPCERDREYAKAALGFNHKKDYGLALKTAGRISAPHVRDSVSQYVYYDMAADAADAKDPNAINDARKYAERISAAEQRAMLNLTVAAAALRQGDFRSAAGFLFETQELAGRSPDARTEAGVLIATAAVFAGFDATEASKVLRQAVKVINRTGDSRAGSFRLIRRVNFACKAGEESWYGGSAPVTSASLLKVLTLTAKLDVEDTLQVARGIDSAAIRIPALASIIKAVLQDQRGRPISASRGDEGPVLK